MNFIFVLSRLFTVAPLYAYIFFFVFLVNSIKRSKLEKAIHVGWFTFFAFLVSWYAYSRIIEGMHALPETVAYFMVFLLIGGAIGWAFTKVVVDKESFKITISPSYSIYVVYAVSFFIGCALEELKVVEAVKEIMNNNLYFTPECMILLVINYSLALGIYWAGIFKSYFRLAQ